MRYLPALLGALAALSATAAEAKTSFHLGLYAPLPVYPAPYYAAPYPYYAPPAYPAYEPECRTVWDREDVWDEEEEDWVPREEPRRICD